MIKSINGWRAVFALMIVLFHVGVADLEEMTWAGVTFFFMASGFLLALKHPFEHLDGQSWRHFAWNHAVKLFPLHWLTLVIWIAAMAVLGLLVIKPLALVANALLLHSWSLSHSVYFSYNRFSWFLSTLLFCYLCYPLLSNWLSSMRLRSRLVIAASLALIDIVVLAITGSNDYYRTALYVFPPVRIIDFIIGMVLAGTVARVRELPVIGKGGSGTDAELIALALLSVVVMSYRSYGWLLPWSDAIVWWLPVAVILLSCVIYDKREGFVGKFLASRPLQWLGDISFEIFILQGVAALIFNYLCAPALAHLGFGHPSPFDTPWDKSPFSVSPYSLIPWFILPIDILLAWLVNRLFTRPVSRMLRR